MKLIDGHAMIQRVEALHKRGTVDLSYYNIVKEAVQMEPSVDAVPVVHGQWEGYNADYTDWQRNDGPPIFISCCVCHNVVLYKGSASWNYCPNCGAKNVQ